MARYGWLLADAQWEKIRPLLPKRPPRPRGGQPPAPERQVLEGILWFRAAGHGGRICPRSFPRHRPAGDGCETGRSKKSG